MLAQSHNSNTNPLPGRMLTQSHNSNTNPLTGRMLTQSHNSNTNPLPGRMLTQSHNSNNNKKHLPGKPIELIKLNTEPATIKQFLFLFVSRFLL